MRSKNSKKKALTKALNLAKKEADVGLNVMVLLPSVDWIGDMPLTYGHLDAPGTRYIRFSNSHAGLRSVAINTLIMVARCDPTWDAAGEAIARSGLPRYDDEIKEMENEMEDDAKDGL
jgi:hypothetical protein